MPWGMTCHGVAGVGLGAPGPTAIPMALAGAPGRTQEVRGLTSWQSGTAKGGGHPSTVPRSWIAAKPFAPGQCQGEGNRSLWVLLVRQVHDCLGPSDIFVVCQVANALDVKGLLQGVGITAGQAQGCYWSIC